MSGVLTVPAGRASPDLNRARQSGPMSLGSVGEDWKGSPGTTSISGSSSATARTWGEKKGRERRKKKEGEVERVGKKGRHG